MSEIIRLRSLNSKTFDLGGGKFRQDHSMVPLHYVDAQGNLQDIDVTAVLDAGGNYVINAAPYGFTLKNQTFRYTSPGNGAVVVTLASVGGVSLGTLVPTYANGKFTFPNIAQDTDYVIEPWLGGCRTKLILKSALAPTSWSWNITGATSMMHPIIGEDANGRPTDLTINQVGNALNVSWSGKVIANRLSLRSGATPSLIAPAYPVAIDPSFSETLSGATNLAWEKNAYTRPSGLVGMNGKQLTNRYNVYQGSYRYAGYYCAFEVGMRFTGVTVPPAANISAATLSIWVNNYNNNENLRIYGVASDNAAAFAGINPITHNNAAAVHNLPRTTAFTAWNGKPLGFDALDVKSIVQEIVNRAGWVSGNAMAFLDINNIFPPKAVSNYGQLRGINGNPNPPALSITYSTGQPRSAIAFM